MAYQSLYRRWRPMTFDEVVGQKHITDTIKNEVASGVSGHAFLFCGTRGTGKTSTARIFARAINCLNNKDGNPCNECAICKGLLDGSIMDVTEIDAASYSGVDNIRALRDEANYAPAAAKYKVYIIDEVHGLSTSAFNALLKVLEEPPAHVKFILATTEAHKVIGTIASRCQRFDFREIPIEDIKNRIFEICNAEGIIIEEEAVDIIAQEARGSLRDALSMLEPCIDSDKKVDTASVREKLGFGEASIVSELCKAVGENNSATVLKCIDMAAMSGSSMKVFSEAVLRALRACMVYAILNTRPPGENESDWKRLEPAAQLFSADKAMYAVNSFSQAMSVSRYATTPRYIIEAALLKLCNLREETSFEALEARVGELEKRIAKGVFVQEAKNEADTPIKEKKAEPPKKKQQKTAPDNQVIEKIKSKWPEIQNRTVNDMTLFAAIQTSGLRMFEQKVALVYSDDTFKTYRDMVTPGLDTLKAIIYDETGLDVSLTVKSEDDFANEHTENVKDAFDEIASFPGVEIIE